MSSRAVSGPLLVLDVTACREWLGTLLPAAREAHWRGQVDRAEALLALVRPLSEVVATDRPVFQPEFPDGTSDVLGAGSGEWVTPVEAAGPRTSAAALLGANGPSPAPHPAGIGPD